MSTFLRFLELLAMSMWLGSIVFFSFFNAPVLFRVLGEKDAGRAVRGIFPRYYLLGTVCGLVLCAVSAARGVLWMWSGLTTASLLLFGALTVLTIFARQWLTPRINAASDAGPSRRREFDGLHKSSVRLNGVVLLLLLAYLGWMAARGW